jgi:hypothetical protein
MTDAETTAAENALAYRIRERDAAVRDGDGDVADPEVFAHEFFTALRTKGGWRPTPAKAYPAPKAVPPGSAPVLRPETAELREALRADMEARAARDRAAREGAA